MNTPLVFLTRSLKMPEVSVHLLNLIEALEKRPGDEFEVAVITEDLARAMPHVKEGLAAAGADVRKVSPLPKVSYFSSGFGRREFENALLKCIGKLKGFRGLREDIPRGMWHAVSVELALLAKLAPPYKLPPPTVSSFYRTRLLRGNRRAIRQVTPILGQVAVDAITTASPRWKENLTDGWSLPLPNRYVEEDRAYSLPFALNTELFRPPGPEERRKARKTLGLSPGKRTVVLLPWPSAEGQRPELLLSALVRLEVEGLEATALFAGPNAEADENSQNPIRQYALDRGVSSQVHFFDTGWRRKALRQAIWASDVAVWLARPDQVGVPIAQAMLGGIPPVRMRSNGAAADQIDDKKTGYIIPVGQVGALADRLGRLLDEEARRERMGRSAKNAARERHARDRVVDQLLSVYASVNRRLKERWEAYESDLE